MIDRAVIARCFVWLFAWDIISLWWLETDTLNITEPSSPRASWVDMKGNSKLAPLLKLAHVSSFWAGFVSCFGGTSRRFQTSFENDRRRACYLQPNSALDSFITNKQKRRKSQTFRVALEKRGFRMLLSNFGWFDKKEDVRRIFNRWILRSVRVLRIITS